MNAYGMAFENKFEQATETFGVGVNKSSINPGDNPNGTPPIGADGPIGDGIGVLSVLGIVYALYQHRKRKVPVSVE
ncbi:hypothetical protein FACS189451_02070 [Bacteroidia bacterium]|nr:hypothetical protein FACS189451_02070 [Bacteroidia bacterium]